LTGATVLINDSQATGEAMSNASAIPNVVETTPAPPTRIKVVSLDVPFLDLVGLLLKLPLAWLLVGVMYGIPALVVTGVFRVLTGE
jgi:hypothetical protein